MITCTHCAEFASETAAIRQLVADQATTLALTQASVQRMEKMLLGNGQPGKIQLHDAELAHMREWQDSMSGAMKATQWMLGIALTLGTALGAAVLGKR